MRILEGRNVNELWCYGQDLLLSEGERQDSRAGVVSVVPFPVMSIYRSPCERVLLDPVRRANPFFHLMESLWMLAGRDDAAFLNDYIRNFGERFAEPNGRIHGAYGKRWFDHFGRDQLSCVIDILKRDPDSRQAVIQMWDAVTDLGVPDLKDRPCNTQIYLRIQSGSLDLTVTCRSNDIVWGAYGANAVHFSMLHEYLAGRLGVGVGTMYQFSNNWHAYEDVFDSIVSVYDENGDPFAEAVDPYAKGDVSSYPIGDAWPAWDEDLRTFMDWHDSGDTIPVFANTWFNGVPVQMVQVHQLWREKNMDAARELAQKIVAPDWRAAVLMWIR